MPHFLLRSKKKYILIIIFAILASCKKDIEPVFKSNSDSAVRNSEEKELISVIAVGDIMLGTTYPSNDLPPNDGKNIFDEVKDILKDSYITCGNLEGTFLDHGGTPKKCKEETNCYSFRTPTRYADYLMDARFDFLNLANNHSGDMGLEGRESTFKTLENLDIKYAGLLEKKTSRIKKGGLVYGFAGFAPNSGTCNINNSKEAVRIVKELKDECDIVIVFFHGGAEGSSAFKVNGQKEYFLGEDRGDVYKFSHSVIDAGADLVFGSGPHIPRAIELYNGRLISYSLGNFCTYGKFNISGALGYAPIIKVFINEKGEFINGQIYSARQIKRGIPVIDENMNAFKFIKFHTNKDFPVTKLFFNDKGEIFRKE